MWKLSLLTFLLFVGFTVVVLSNPSKTYWENVGPAWDKMLNPNKYSNEE